MCKRNGHLFQLLKVFKSLIFMLYMYSFRYVFVDRMLILKLGIRFVVTLDSNSVAYNCCIHNCNINLKNVQRTIFTTLALFSQKCEMHTNSRFKCYAMK